MAGLSVHDAPAVSCGVLVLCAEGYILLGHSTGSPRWDIPKGMGEPGEPALHTALRECEEEIGLVLTAKSLVDLGRRPYLRSKDLHLFATVIDRIDTATCRCTTYFVDARGHQRPEMDAFEWVPWADAPGRTGKNMALALTDALKSAPVRALLAARGAGGKQDA